jgi:SAM-dependent MidA family methyltransferase
MGTPLVAALTARISATGPIPFDEFMRISLYDAEDGYFATGPLRSVAGGDFLTSPEVSPWFGRVVARFVADVAGERRLPVTVVDAGAGSGRCSARCSTPWPTSVSLSPPMPSRCRRRHERHCGRSRG